MAHEDRSLSKKTRMSKSKIKNMLSCFFDCHVIVRKEFVLKKKHSKQKKTQKKINNVRLEIANSWMYLKF